MLDLFLSVKGEALVGPGHGVFAGVVECVCHL